MDQRQAQIRERAGLEEGKINEDFVDFMKKYGIWFLLIAALAGGATSAKRYYAEYKENKVDAAFFDLESARKGGNASPEALTAVANDHEGVRQVSNLARLEAGDAYLAAIRRGIKSGAKVDKDGKLENADDLLQDSDRDMYLSKAAGMYQSVYDSTKADPTKKLTTMDALYGLAAVAECKRDFEGAKGRYDEIVSLVDNTTYAPQALVAKGRIEKLPKLAALAKLRPKDELPKLAEEEKPPAPPVAEPIAAPPGAAPTTLPDGSPGSPVDIQPIAPPTPGNPVVVPVQPAAPPATGPQPAPPPALQPAPQPANPATPAPAQPSVPPK